MSQIVVNRLIDRRSVKRSDGVHHVAGREMVEVRVAHIDMASRRVVMDTYSGSDAGLVCVGRNHLTGTGTTGIARSRHVAVQRVFDLGGSGIRYDYLPVKLTCPACQHTADHSDFYNCSDSEDLDEWAEWFACPACKTQMDVRFESETLPQDVLTQLADENSALDRASHVVTLWRQLPESGQRYALERMCGATPPGFPEVPVSVSYCSVCGGVQKMSPSGLVCDNGHGDAPSIEKG